MKKKWKVNKNGCWIWPNNNWSAHRRVWEKLKGKIPKGKFLCHLCDVPRCVNPDHQYIGDVKSNNKDYWDRHYIKAKRQLMKASKKGLAIANARYAANPKLKQKVARLGGLALKESMTKREWKLFLARRGRAISEAYWRAN